MRSLLRLGFVWLALSFCGLAVSAEVGDTSFALTPEELAWIKAHPVLRVGVGAYGMPVEYVRNEKVLGLSGQYLAVVARNTGLRFEYVTEGRTTSDRLELLRSGAVDLVSAAQRNSMLAVPQGVLFTLPYHVSPLIIATRTHERVVFDVESLAGKTISIASSNTLRRLVAERSPNSKILVSRSSTEALDMVVDGRSYATIGTASYLAPLLQGAYSDALQIAGIVGGMTTEVGMAVRSDQPLLKSILEKSILSLSAEDKQTLRLTWLTEAERSALNIRSVAGHYAREIALLALAVGLLAALAFLAYRQRLRARRSEQEKSMFLAVMSHEIRSPLNAVLSAVELLRITSLDARQKRFADLAISGSNTLLRVVDDVLDVSKLEAGQLKLRLEPVDVHALVMDVVDLHRIKAAAKDVLLTTDIEAGLGLLMLDTSRMAQLLHNLISNSIKFTEQGGVEVKVSTSTIDQGKTPSLLIAVADSGIGISEPEQALLFQPYFQVDRAQKGSRGTGLGLVICRELVRMMQGTIEVGSKIGVGTTVAVTVPKIVAVDQAESTSVDASAAAHAPSPPVKAIASVYVLVVEDTPANQEVLVEQIRSLGCTPWLAQDGASALQQFEGHEFDLVLLDCQLPDTDGYAVAEAMRDCEKDLKRARCPILAISASTGSEHEARCFAADMDGVLSKPIGLSKLKDAIELWCGVAVAKPTPPARQQDIAVEAMHGSLAGDVTALLQALALGEADAAMRAAHRLNGATSTLGLPGVAQASQRIESLLRAGVAGEDETCRAALMELLAHWYAIDPNLSNTAM